MVKAFEKNNSSLLKRRTTAVDNTAEEIRYRIISRRYIQEQEITEDLVANDCNTSRSTARAALKELENEGLIYTQSNGRKIVLGFSEKYLEDLYEVRKMLELKAIKEVLNNEDYRLKFLSVAFEIIGKINEQDLSNRDEHAYYDLMIHKSILMESRNQILIQCWILLAPVFWTLLKVSSKKSNDREYYSEYFEAHNKIVQALGNKQENSIDILEKHLELSKKLLLETLKDL